MMKKEDEVKAMETRLCELLRMRSKLDEDINTLEQNIANTLALFKPGQRVLYRAKGEYEITAVRKGYGLRSVKYFGRKVLKSGKLHANSSELWVFDVEKDLIPVEKAQENG